MKKPATLYHYTCRCSWNKIRQDQTLIPNKHPWLAEPLIWLTDLQKVNRDALGLTSMMLACDRGEIRIPVSLDYAVPWMAYANAAQVQVYVRRLFNGAPSLPRRWWVSMSPITLDVATIEAVEAELAGAG